MQTMHLLHLAAFMMMHAPALFPAAVPQLGDLVLGASRARQLRIMGEVFDVWLKYTQVSRARLPAAVWEEAL